MAIADVEGYEGVSMRRIAADLGSGTMTLYHYVGSKDELLELMFDAIMNEIAIPDEELPEGWREGLTELARQALAVFKRHPWVAETRGLIDPYKGGPGLLRYVEQALKLAARTGASPDEQWELMATVDDYVFGFVMRLHDFSRSSVAREDDRRQSGMAAYLTSQFATGEYDYTHAILGDDPLAGFARLSHLAHDEQRFERGLHRLMDGLELWVQQLQQERGFPAAMSGSARRPG